MANLSIKEVPEAITRALRERAARNHRSMQGELMAILEAAVAGQKLGPAELFVITPVASGAARKSKAVVVSEATRSFAEVAAEFRQKFPKQLGGSLESTEIIREMRDTHYGDAWVMGGIKDGHWPPQPGDSEPIPGFGLYPTNPADKGDKA